MRKNKIRTLLTAALIMVFCGLVTDTISAQEPNYKTVPSGTKVKVKGIISKRDSDFLVMKDGLSPDLYYVEVTPSTEVKTSRKGILKGGKEYPASYLLRGLLIEVKGYGNAEGRLVAETIKFEEEDLRNAQALEVRFDPVEAEVASNKERIAAQEENAKRMAGQIEENAALTAAAQAEAERANNRINGLGEYDPVKTITVPFATGSSTLGPKGRAIIDEAAAWVKTQNTRGWMVAVVGFADSTGNTVRNKTLSEKRANAVIGYLVTKHSLPLTRLVQPFGAGVDMPAATNTTASGRAANRRVEIRLLVNKGIAGK